MIRDITLTVLVMAAVAMAGWHFHGNDPNKNVLDDLPDAPEAHLGNLSDVRFLLWTRSNTGDDDHYRLLPGNLTNLNESPFDGNLPTHVIYHGYNDNGEAGWIRSSKTILLEMYECNVISVDWQTLVPSPWYNFAVENAFKVGNYTAGLIDWLNTEKGLHPSQVHIVGHSLGSHTAGFTGKYVTSGQVARITGLDPAGPLFYEKDADHRIDKSDAAYVDIIHANSGSLLEGCIALLKPVGHTDFYPNGGKHQPGCEDKNGSIVEDWIDLFEGCSHARVTALWVESISALSPDQMFTSWPCVDYETFLGGNCPDCGLGCLQMGFHVDESLRGGYFLRTHSEEPYALGNQQ